MLGDKVTLEALKPDLPEESILASNYKGGNNKTLGFRLWLREPIVMFYVNSQIGSTLAESKFSNINDAIERYNNIEVDNNG